MSTESHEAFVEQRDFLPVDHARRRAMRVERLDRSLQLIAARARERSRGAQMLFGLVDRRPGPERGVLLIERHEFALAGVARRAAGFAVEHERQ